MQTVPAFDRIGEENAFAVLARATELAAKGRDIINLGIGQPDFSTPPHIVEAAAKALRDGHHGYTPANGIKELREAVAADLHRRHNVTIDPGTVLIVPGGKVTMFFAIMMFGRPGIEIMYPNPGFPIYESTIRFSGATAVPIRPMPTMPSRLPPRRWPSMWVGLHPWYRPSRIMRAPSTRRRGTPTIRAMVMSAVSSVSTSGVLETMMPRACAAGTSI